jgi:DNA-binding transcriptional LysR family regulator
VELRHLRYFVAVGEELHFGRAAARLHIAQPPLSQQIRQLEGELGFQLLVRAHRRVRLTEAGAAFLAEARAILERVDRAAADAGRLARGETGSLAIGFIASTTWWLVPALLHELRRRQPGVDLTLAELSTDEQLAALRAGDIQLGLGRPPANDPAIAAEPLLDEPLALALPSGHHLARLRSVPLRALADEPFVLFPRRPRPGWADRVLDACREAGFLPHVAQEVLELSTALALVAAGVGVTLVPGSVQALRPRGLLYRPLAPPAPTTRLLALYRREDAPPTVARFVELARAVLARDGASASGAGRRRARAGRGAV